MSSTIDPNGPQIVPGIIPVSKTKQIVPLFKNSSGADEPPDCDLVLKKVILKIIAIPYVFLGQKKISSGAEKNRPARGTIVPA